MKNNNLRNKKNENKLYIYGKQPLLLSLENKKREFLKIYVANIEEFKKIVENKKILVNFKIVEQRKNDFISNLIGQNVNHQGFLAEVRKRKTLSLDDFILKYCQNKQDLPKLLLLDEIQDPHNIGAIMRTATAFDIKNIIITSRNSIGDSSVIIKSSAGYSEFINLIEVNNLNYTIENLKKVGYFVIGLDGNTDKMITDIKKSNNFCLVLGSEGFGIRPLVKKNCDMLTKIEMKNGVESLNVSVACAIAIYQLWGTK